MTIARDFRVIDDHETETKCYIPVQNSPWLKEVLLNYSKDDDKMPKVIILLKETPEANQISAELKEIAGELQPREKDFSVRNKTIKAFLEAMDDALDVGGPCEIIFEASPTSHIRSFLNKADLSLGMQAEIMKDLEACWRARGLG